MCDLRYLPFPLGEWIGQEMEWSWRHQHSKVENFYREEDGEWITDPTQVLYVANELYPWTERIFLSNVELALT